MRRCLSGVVNFVSENALPSLESPKTDATFYTPSLLVPPFSVRSAATPGIAKTSEVSQHGPGRYDNRECDGKTLYARFVVTSDRLSDCVVNGRRYKNVGCGVGSNSNRLCASLARSPDRSIANFDDVRLPANEPS